MPYADDQMPSLPLHLAQLSQLLQTRLQLYQPLLSLSGRLDLALAQIQMRRIAAEQALANADTRNGKRTEGERYIEGESEDEEDVPVEIDVDDGGEVEDVDMRGYDGYVDVDTGVVYGADAVLVMMSVKMTMRRTKMRMERMMKMRMKMTMKMMWMERMRRIHLNQGQDRRMGFWILKRRRVGMMRLLARRMSRVCTASWRDLVTMHTSKEAMSIRYQLGSDFQCGTSVLSVYTIFIADIHGVSDVRKQKSTVSRPGRFHEQQMQSSLGTSPHTKRHDNSSHGHVSFIHLPFHLLPLPTATKLARAIYASPEAVMVILALVSASPSTPGHPTNERVRKGNSLPESDP